MIRPRILGILRKSVVFGNNDVRCKHSTRNGVAPAYKMSIKKIVFERDVANIAEFPECDIRRTSWNDSPDKRTPFASRNFRIDRPRVRRVFRGQYVQVSLFSEGVSVLLERGHVRAEFICIQGEDMVREQRNQAFLTPRL